MLKPENVTLGLLQDDAILRQAAELVRWLQQRWPGSRFEYGGVEQTVESILPE